MSRPKGKMHRVAVRASVGASGELRFEPESEIWNKADERFHFHKDQHGMKKDDFHLVEFVLDDRTGDELRFPETPHDAMWVARVEDPSSAFCPDIDTTSDYSVLEPICVCDEGQRLIVRNANPREEQWSFTINFVKGDSLRPGNYVSWDPITDNHDGGV